jgi:hypothetical protein
MMDVAGVQVRWINHFRLVLAIMRSKGNGRIPVVSTLLLTSELNLLL